MLLPGFSNQHDNTITLVSPSFHEEKHYFGNSGSEESRPRYKYHVIVSSFVLVGLGGTLGPLFVVSCRRVESGGHNVLASVEFITYLHIYYFFHHLILNIFLYCVKLFFILYVMCMFYSIMI